MDFFESVYEIVRKIPTGKVTTYGLIAKMLGKPKASRAVGWALNKNPDNNRTPCHRVVNKEGKVSSAFAFGGVNMQIKLLKKEGICIKNDKIVDLNRYLWNNNEK